MNEFLIFRLNYVSKKTELLLASVAKMSFYGCKWNFRKTNLFHWWFFLMNQFFSLHAESIGSVDPVGPVCTQSPQAKGLRHFLINLVLWKILVWSWFQYDRGQFYSFSVTGVFVRAFNRAISFLIFNKRSG